MGGAYSTFWSDIRWEELDLGVDTRMILKLLSRSRMDKNRVG